MDYDCLIIDDEESIGQSVSEYFNMFDISTTYITSYAEGIDFLKKHHVSLLLLDVNLGTESGFLFCKEIRKYSSIPIIFISARDSDEDILSGLNIGGDDYITKPFKLSILLAKVNARLKRAAANHIPESPLQNDDIISFGNIQLDANTQRVYKKGSLIRMKPKEFALLQYFTKNPNRVITKDELLEKVWRDSYVGEGTLSVHIRHLREKIEADPNTPVFIKTIWGTGYLFEAPL